MHMYVCMYVFALPRRDPPTPLLEAHHFLASTYNTHLITRHHFLGFFLLSFKPV